MKHIRMSYIEVPEYNVIVAKIEEQTHKGKSFGIIDESFIAGNGVVIYSSTFPAFSYDSTKAMCNLYCRGYSDKRDDDVFFIPIKYFEKIKDAIENYNKMFGKLDEEEGRIKYIG